MRPPHRFAVGLLGIAVVALAARPAPSAASFSRQRATTASLGTSTLDPPTLALAVPSGVVVSCSVALAWTASPSSFLAGYTVQRYKAGNPDGASHALGIVTAYVDTGISLSTTYTWTITARAGTAWTSSAASVTKAVSGACL